MQKLNIKAAVLVAILAIIGGGGALYVANNPGKTADRPAVTQNAEQKAKLTISNDGKTVQYDGQTGKTALELLKSLGDIETQQSSYGEFVTGINGVKTDGTKQFWAFYVNGKLASEGAGTYKTTNGESIEWRVEDVQQ